MLLSFLCARLDITESSSCTCHKYGSCQIKNKYLINIHYYNEVFNISLINAMKSKKWHVWLVYNWIYCIFLNFFGNLVYLGSVWIENFNLVLPSVTGVILNSTISICIISEYIKLKLIITCYIWYNQTVKDTRLSVFRYSWDIRFLKTTKWQQFFSKLVSNKNLRFAIQCILRVESKPLYSNRVYEN